MNFLELKNSPSEILHELCRVFFPDCSLVLHDEVGFFSFCFVNWIEWISKQMHIFLDDVAAEKAIERALKDVRDQIAKGAADCK